MPPPKDATPISFEEAFETLKDNSFMRMCIDREHGRIYAQFGSLDTLTQIFDRPDFTHDFIGIGSAVGQPGAAHYMMFLEHTFFSPMSDAEPLFTQFYIRWNDCMWTAAFIPRELGWTIAVAAIETGMMITDHKPSFVTVDKGVTKVVELPVRCLGIMDGNPNSPHYREGAECLRLLSKGIVSVQEANRRISRVEKSMFKEELEKIDALARKLGISREDLN